MANLNSIIIVCISFYFDNRLNVLIVICLSILLRIIFFRGVKEINLNIRDLYNKKKGCRFVPEQLSRKAKSLDSQNWTGIRYEIGTVFY
jgi:hypothetical protein